MTKAEPTRKKTFFFPGKYSANGMPWTLFSHNAPNFFSSLYKCPLSLALQGLAHDLSWLQTPCNPLFISYKPTYAREISGSLFRSTYLIYNKHQCLLSLPSSLLLALLFLLVVRLHESLSDPLLQGDSNRIFKRKIPSILSAK